MPDRLRKQAADEDSVPYSIRISRSLLQRIEDRQRWTKEKKREIIEKALDYFLTDRDRTVIQERLDRAVLSHKRAQESIESLKNDLIIIPQTPICTSVSVGDDPIDISQDSSSLDVSTDGMNWLDVLSHKSNHNPEESEVSNGVLGE